MGGTDWSWRKAVAFTRWHEPDESRGSCPESVSGSGRNSPGRLGYRAVIDGGYLDDEPVGQRRGRSSLHYGGEGVLIHPPYQGVCGRHGTEEQCVTSGGLAGSLGGAGVSRPISESEVASEALSVVRRLNSTYEA